MTSHRPPDWLRLHPEVSQALAVGRPIVALESSLITHGLPRPDNLHIAAEMEARVRASGAVPATIAVLGGVPLVGLAEAQLQRLALESQAQKLSRANLAVALASGDDGGTTVSATMLLAHAAGVKIFATGGIGGVHRGDSGDVSADLPELERTPVAVVCSGAKSILDLPRTFEWLETAGVPILGWQSSEFPAFFTRHSGLRLHESASTATQAAQALRAHWRLPSGGGALVTVPCPEESALDADHLEVALGQAQAEAEAQSVHGPALTPFLLERLSELTQGATLRANHALLLENVRVASEIAAALGEN